MSLNDLIRAARGARRSRQPSENGTPGAESPGASPTAAEPEGSQTVPSPLPTDVTREIDVSHLPPPLPMVRILETLRGLGPNETLLVHHTRRPIHLYPKLEALGCQHETTETAPGKIEVRITNPPARPS